MGKVFTWSEVEDGRVPAFSDYSVVMDKIKHDIAHTDGVIVQREVFAVIIGAHLILGEPVGIREWCGVFVAVYGSWLLTHSLGGQLRQVSD